MAEGQQPTFAARIRVRGTQEVKQAFGDVKKSGEETFGSLRRSAAAVGTATEKTANLAVSTTKAAVSTATAGIGAIGTVLSGLAGVASFVIDGILGIASAVAKGALLVGGAAVGAYVAARSWTTGIAEGNAEIARQAQAVGMSVESLSRWQAAVRLAGGDAKAVTGAFESIRGKMLDVAKGVDGADTAFRQLDIRVRNADGSLKNSEVLFDEVVTNLAKISDEGVRSAAAYDLFGGAATSLLPVLRRGTSGLSELQDQAERYGTALTTAQAAETDALLEKKRNMEEALRGASNRISNAFLPIFTASATSVAAWLEANGAQIEDWATRAAVTLGSFLADVQSLFGSAGARDLTHRWLADLRGPALTLKGLVLDIIDAMAGRGVSRTPWLADFVDTAGEAYNTGNSLVLMAAELAGVLDQDFNIAQSFRDATAAMIAFQDGVAGNVGDVAWASDLGATVSLLAGGIATVAATIADNKEAITAFAADVAAGFGDLTETVRAMLSGEGVDAGNAFAWLAPLVDQIMVKFEEVKAVGVAVWTDIVDTLDSVRAAGQWIIDVMDMVAKAMGLKDWKSLGIILAIAQVSGALGVFQMLATSIAAISVFVSNIVTVITALAPLIAGIATKIFSSILAPAAVAIAGFLGIPVAVVAGIGVAIAGIIALLIVFQGDIGKVFGFIWDIIRWPFEMLWELNKLVWSAVGDLAGKAVEGLKALFAPLGEFFSGVLSGIGGMFSGMWDAISGGAQSAWDGIAGVFGGFGDFFAGLIDQVKNMFTGLWDGVKNGAAGAWEAVKGFFGFGGGSEPGATPSYDVGTSRVPGADGQPMLATIHGGERILTVAENKRFGAMIEALASMTTLPVTPFSMGPTAKPSGSGGGGGDMMRADFDLNGKKHSFQGAPSSVRALRSGMRRAQRMTTFTPRWSPT